jgi:hypothetical protein
VVGLVPLIAADLFIKMHVHNNIEQCEFTLSIATCWPCTLYKISHVLLFRRISHHSCTEQVRVTLLYLVSEFAAPGRAALRCLNLRFNFATLGTRYAVRLSEPAKRITCFFYGRGIAPAVLHLVPYGHRKWRRNMPTRSHGHFDPSFPDVHQQTS